MSIAPSSSNSSMRKAEYELVERADQVVAESAVLRCARRPAGQVDPARTTKARPAVLPSDRKVELSNPGASWVTSRAWLASGN